MAATSRENAAFIGRFLTEVVASDTNVAGGILAGEVTASTLVFGQANGNEPVAALCWSVFAAVDIDVGIEDTVATDDQVAVPATVTGTHRESPTDPVIADHAGLLSGGVPTATVGSHRSAQLGTVPDPPANRPLTDPTS